MNHTFLPQPIPSGAISVKETCCRCGQSRLRYLSGNTIYYQQTDGTWAMKRPGPCSKEHARQRLAAEIDKAIQFFEIKKT